MKTKLPALLLAIVFITSSCQANESDLKNQDLLNAVLWMQHAAEYKALCLQAYNSAENMLDIALKDKDWTAALEQNSNYKNLPPAIILDVDETVLDNSPYEAILIQTGTSFSAKSWNDWCMQQRAESIPGAVEFCNLAAEKGITIFYVTNRREDVAEATKNNLQKMGFPFKDEVQTLLPRTDTGDKGPRRTQIAESYRILLLIGDNNGDFASGFTKADQTTRDTLVERYNSYWGTKWIVLPNPAYGDWEGLLYDYNYRLPGKEKSKLKLEKLRN